MAAGGVQGSRTYDEAFFRANAARIYEELSDGLRRVVRVERLVELASSLHPDHVPSPAQVEAEREHLQKDKEPLEIAQGLLLAHVLADAEAGRHLIDVMLRPTEDRARPPRGVRARRPSSTSARSARAPRRSRGSARAAQPAPPQRRGRHDAAARSRPRSTSCCSTREVEIGVLRGGVVEHPRYAGRRIFGAGLNLTHLYRGQISYLFFPVRDLGLVHKVYRGLSAAEPRPGSRPRSCGSPPPRRTRSAAAASCC